MFVTDKEISGPQVSLRRRRKTRGVFHTVRLVPRLPSVQPLFQPESHTTFCASEQLLAVDINTRVRHVLSTDRIAFYIWLDSGLFCANFYVVSCWIFIVSMRVNVKFNFVLQRCQTAWNLSKIIVAMQSLFKCSYLLTNTCQYINCNVLHQMLKLCRNLGCRMLVIACLF